MRISELVELLDLTAPPAWGVERRLATCRNIDDLRRAFERAVPRAVADFVSGGAEDEVTLRRNVEAFRAATLLPRTFRGVPEADPSTELFGARVRLPLGLAPTGIIRIVHLCAYCDNVIAATGNWRDGAVVLAESRIADRYQELGMRVRRRVELAEVVLREHFCASCGGALDVDVVLEGHPALPSRTALVATAGSARATRP